MAMKEGDGWCPCGCLNSSDHVESDFDTNGYCKHLVGFITLLPGQSAVGRLYEPLEAIEYPVRDEQGKPLKDEHGKPIRVHSGLMRLNGRKRQPVLDGDIIVGPEELQERLTIRRKGAEGQDITIKPRLGIPSRVYRKTATTPVVVRARDDDPAGAIRLKMEEKLAEYDELQHQANEIDKARKPVEIDEEAEAAKVALEEKRRMRETVGV